MLMLFSKPHITACDKKMPTAHTSFITTAEDSVLDLWLKHSVSAKVKVADGVTCSWRDVPFGRGRFEPLPLVTRGQGVRVKMSDGIGP